MTWHTFCEVLAEEAQQKRGWLKRDAKAFVTNVFDSVLEAVAENRRLFIPGFGVFRLSGQKARTVLNVATGKPMRLPARKRIAFRASKEWRSLDAR